MSDLESVAARHNVPVDAAQHVLDALARGHGAMAQFNHPALGGMGQWTAGGMTMVGDMFNTSLQAKVASLCTDLLPLLSRYERSGERQASSSAGTWWPSKLGHPSSAGSQNDSHYAFFPDARRLAVKAGGQVTVYDTGDHRIGGVSQQQGGGSDVSFTSQLGVVRLHDLRVVRDADDDRAPSHAAAAPATERGRPTQSPPVPHGMPHAPTPSTNQTLQTAAPFHQTTSGSHDVLATLERLADLRQKGVLTDEEFAAKKRDLLARL